MSLKNKAIPYSHQSFTGIRPEDLRKLLSQICKTLHFVVAVVHSPWRSPIWNWTP